MLKIKGELEIGGYRFVLDMNALATLEDITKKGAFETLAEMENGRANVTTLRAFYFACLKRHQPDITIEEAGDIFSEHPNALNEVVEAAFPKSDGEAGNGKKPVKKTAAK